MTTIDIKDTAIAARAAKRIIHREDGSIVIPVQDGLYDVFQGRGWYNHSRFRITRQRLSGKLVAHQMYHISGTTMPRELRETLLKEL